MWFSILHNVNINGLDKVKGQLTEGEVGGWEREETRKVEEKIETQ